MGYWLLANGLLAIGLAGDFRSASLIAEIRAAR